MGLICEEEDGQVRDGERSGVGELWGCEIAAEQGDKGARSYQVHPQRPKGSIFFLFLLYFDPIAFDCSVILLFLFGYFLLCM